MTRRFDERVPIALAFAASAILHAVVFVVPRWQHAHAPEPPAPLTVELARPAQPLPVATPEPLAAAPPQAAARPPREPPPKPAPRSAPEPRKRDAPPVAESPPPALRALVPAAPAPAAEPAVATQGTPETAPARAAASAPSASAPGTAEGQPRTVPPAYGAAYLRNPPPRYPAEARRGGAEGTVLLRVWVDADGAATRVEVDRTSGHRALDEAAVAAVKNWRFVPARRGGEAVEGLVTVPLVFRLDASG